MLRLPDVTLVMVETREHELARMAIKDCVTVAEFGAFAIITDRPAEFYDFNYLKPTIKAVPDWPDKLGWSRSWWYDVPPLLRTSHTLNIQWDSWIWRPEMWRDEFMRYDYVGAPWWYEDGRNVGNGGFSLVSTALKRYLRDHRADFPCDTHVDDDLLCRKYRPALELAGFRWAPESVAHDFAFECCRPSPTSSHFGFHAMFNWPKVLDRERLLERVRIAMRSPYINRPGSYIKQAFIENNRELANELLSEGATT